MVMADLGKLNTLWQLQKYAVPSTFCSRGMSSVVAGSVVGVPVYLQKILCNSVVGRTFLGRGSLGRSSDYRGGVIAKGRFLGMAPGLGVVERRSRATTSERVNEDSDVGLDVDLGRKGSGDSGEGGGDGDGGGDAFGWISSALVFALWAGFIAYAYFFAPNQTPYRDSYFIQKLCGLKSDDGFVMNQVLYAEFMMMGLWPVLYAMLLIPTGKSSKGGVPVAPFLFTSIALGMFALLPYFGLWRPPPPVVEKSKLSRFPLSWLESKILPGAASVCALWLAFTAVTAGNASWTEFYQYFRESQFIHIMTIDFCLFSTLAPFWIYNDMSARKWTNKGFWLVLLGLLPYFGPNLYLLLRPPLPASFVVESSKSSS